jgi:hypothetical protein
LQPGHRTVRALPQAEQNLLPLEFSLWQCGHFMAEAPARCWPQVCNSFGGNIAYPAA